jgi:hypothetical protein
MARKHNTKHQRSQSAYKGKVQQDGPSRLTDVRLSDGKLSSAKR